jgi:ADP-heptose:LPS heptosyltransferase
VVNRYLKALEPLLGAVERRPPRLHIDPSAGERAGHLLNGGESAGPRIVIHASASAATKVWPSERFAALADQLAFHHAARVHFLGSAEDRPCLEQISRLAQSSHSFHCALPLQEVVAMIAACDLFIGNDSGLSHIAAAVETPLIVLWGPANLNMARPEAPPERCAVLYHELPCREGCPEATCSNPSPYECLLRTEVEDVLAAVRGQLEPGLSRWALPVLPNRVLTATSTAGSTEAW